MRGALCVLVLTLAQTLIGITSEGRADYDKKMRTSFLTRNNPHSQQNAYNMAHLRTNRYFSQYNQNRLSMKQNVYIPNDHAVRTNLELHRENIKNFELKKQRQYYNKNNIVNEYNISKKRLKRQLEEKDPRCEDFESTVKNSISNPKVKDKSETYPNNTNCVTVISSPEGTTIRLTFVDVFHIEDHPQCSYDYLEIRDGERGYANLIGKFCGESFPSQITTSGNHVWLKFHSDDTIEYEGFKIDIEYVPSTLSRSIPEACYYETGGSKDVIDSDNIKKCKDASEGHALDVLWKIETDEGTKIFLNFTHYALARPNECEDNIIQVFGAVLEYDSSIERFCGSMPNTISTKEDPGNIMYIRLFASKTAKATTRFAATYTAYRTLSTPKDGQPDGCLDTEFNCEDNTCIAASLRCDDYADCRLKTDEEDCVKGNIEESGLDKPHIKVVLVIFSLILFGMSFVFLFKCFRKLYQDHKLIKEHIRQSTEDRLDSVAGLTLDASKLRDSEPRDNRTNELYKQQRNLSKLSQMKQTSIDSDFIQETQLDLEDETWPRDIERVTNIIEADDIRVETNGRARSSNTSDKEVIRSRTREREGSREKREIRDASVGVPDTKESACQTRESLFQAEGGALSSDGSTSNSRGFSTFGYSGATLARRSPPPAPAPAPTTTQITFELLHQVPHETKQKKTSDRRPMSSETTRSAPDVIIVSKPIR